ncbi:hypothetical protein QTI33_28425 [Variovorax sp. J22P271]|uniref:hypothetical protein n=1 Tax=Variovorax davisae TaxID=3053515 RepID=UPI002577158C|nr:hypothetical protein [Variovorax sp. J22P271]MDM0036093.1 hypothetical protein [Variovorax sp. J22P271]
MDARSALRSALEKSDLYFDWGYDTRFEYFFKRHDSIGVLIQWKDQDSAQEGLDKVTGLDIIVPGIYLRRGERRAVKTRLFWALTVPRALIRQFLVAVSTLAEVIELAAPVAKVERVYANRSKEVSGGKVLAAVLDDGCSFANARFQQANGTRVVWLWNQDDEARGAPLAPPNGPSNAANFGYGGQFSKADLDFIHPTSFNTQDEAYREAGLIGLRRAASHGTHVMDLLAGSESWEIVFVQFPRNCVDDPTGLWLKRFAFEGLLYIVECAGKATKTIVANISWGPQTGPHDGSSPLEKAIDTLVLEQKVHHAGRTLIVSLPAGNSFGSDSHARIDYSHGGEVDWIVPPDGEIPAFIEFRWPPGVSVSDARLRVAPPSGPAIDASPVRQYGPNNTWWVKLKAVGSGVRGLVVVHPTGGPGNSGHWGPHGRWRIEIDPTPSGVDGAVHVYVARADHNMGARRKAKASQLTDAALESGRYVAPAHRYDEVIDSAVRRSGTINGIGTGTSTYVAAGYVAKPLESAPYSSSGPTRGTVEKPDYACMTDRSAARPGVRATGVRSGTTTVLVGTSTAAPQLGRKLAHNLNPPATKPIPYRKERVGKGCLDCDPALNPPT